MLQATSALEYTLIDLKELNLPFLDEPLKPALGHYAHEHTRAWSRQVSALEGFVLIFPQYNWGYPAPLKNALDFLYAEWAGKPVGMITYGTRGGGKAADQMTSVLTGLHTRLLTGNVRISLPDEAKDETGQLLDERAW